MRRLRSHSGVGGLVGDGVQTEPTPAMNNSRWLGWMAYGLGGGVTLTLTGACPILTALLSQG